MRALPAALLALGLLLAGCSGAPADDSGGDGGDGEGGDGGDGSSSPPRLTVGDHWRHESSGDGAQIVTEVRVAAIEDHAGHEAYRLEGTADTSAAGTTTEVETTTWNRVSDHGTVEARATAHLTFGGFSQESTTTTTYDPPCVTMRWPLQVGMEWSETCTGTTTTGQGTSQTSTQTTNFTVEARESVTVPAGTFDAYRLLVESGGQEHTQWVSREACGMVKSEASADGQTVTTVLTDYEC